MKTNMWDFLCEVTNSAGVLGVTLLVCSTVYMLAKLCKDDETDEE